MDFLFLLLLFRKLLLASFRDTIFLPLVFAYWRLENRYQFNFASCNSSLLILYCLCKKRKNEIPVRRFIQQIKVYLETYIHNLYREYEFYDKRLWFIKVSISHSRKIELEKSTSSEGMYFLFCRHTEFFLSLRF